MKERPIIFSAPMVHAVLEGRKTETRRVIKPQPPKGITFAGQYATSDQTIDASFDWMRGDPKDIDAWEWADLPRFYCAYGRIGDRLWMRETFTAKTNTIHAQRVVYRADSPHEIKVDWTSPIHMPRDCSRVTLELTAVHVERVQEISEEDAIAEGISDDSIQAVLAGAEAGNQREPTPARVCYGILWDDLNAKRGYGWDLNPFVWVLKFKKL